MPAVFADDLFVAHQQRRLVGADLGFQPEPGHGQPQEVVARYARGHDARHHVGIAVELGPELLDQRGFAGADFPGYDDETFFLGQPVHQMRDGPAVAAGAEKESAVRRQQEGQAGQVVEFLVHDGLSELLGDAEDEDILV